MTAERPRRAPALYCACHNPGSGLTDTQLGELERLLVADIEALATDARRIRELRRRLCVPTSGRDAVRAMLDTCLAATRSDFSSAARALRTIDAPGYGLCAACNARIGFETLQRAPAGTWCQRCTSQADRPAMGASATAPDPEEGTFP